MWFTVRNCLAGIILSPERFLGQDLELVRVAPGHDPKSRDADLAGIPSAIANFELSQELLHLARIELEDDLLTDVDAGLLQEGDIRGLSPATLPEEIEPAVALSIAEMFRRRRTGE